MVLDLRCPEAALTTIAKKLDRAVAATLIMSDDDEEARFAIHLAQNMPEETTHPADPYDEESRFAIHLAMQKTPEEIIQPADPYDEESRFMIHLQAKVAEQQIEDAEHRQSLIHKASLEDEFDEEARFLVHSLHHGVEEPQPAVEANVPEEEAPIDVTDDAPAPPPPPPPPPPPAATTEDSEEEADEPAAAEEEEDDDSDNTMPDYVLSAIKKDDSQAISTYLKRRPCCSNPLPSTAVVHYGLLPITVLLAASPNCCSIH